MVSSSRRVAVLPRIAVFDIDGTLTDTMDVDVECYEAAILAELELAIPADWDSFDEITDSAILAEACRRSGRPVPDEKTEARVAAHTGRLLECALAETPGRFRPLPGARHVFAALRSAGWKVAMATGAWRPSAEVKLTGAGIPHEGVPLATSSERPRRRHIIELALAGIPGSAGGRAVYVGDGVWDGRATTSLGMGFVGVGEGARAEALLDAGASAVVGDFEDAASLLANLDRAAARVG